MSLLRWSREWEHWYRRAAPAYWIFLFLCTHLPNLELEGPVRSDKTVHVIAFGILAFVYWRLVESFSRPVSATFVVYAGIVLVLYASADEYTQQFVNRGTDVGDWVANLAGITIVLIALETQRRLANRGKRPDLAPNLAKPRVESVDPDS
jgi:VanZ family protein